MSAVETGHERLEELIVVDALDGLEPDERAELEALLAEHGSGCAGCAELFATYADAAAKLAFSLDPVAPSAGAEDRLVAAARAGERPDLVVIHGDADGASHEPGPAPAPAGPRRGANLRRWAVVVAVAASLAVGAVMGFASAPRPPKGTSSFLGFAASPGTKFAAFPTSDGKHLTVAYRPGAPRAWIFGSGLDKPTGGQTYELWWGLSGTPLTQMHPAGIFVPIHGEIVAAMTVGASAPGTVLGVTIEPPGGSPEPTSNPVFVTTV